MDKWEFANLYYDYKGFNLPGTWYFKSISNNHTVNNHFDVYKEDGVLEVLGKDGWELVTITYRNDHNYYWFKRKITQ